ncbi:MAG: hypothetical protein IPP90_08700 [Gemmatimonadaceae bacterium]|nr:hypothetical protein [Gemmatimonadaceae bacterium]
MPTLSAVSQAVAEQPAQMPPVPAPPAVPQAAAPALAGVPTQFGRADLPALRARRDELSRQITSATSRREEAVDALKSSPAGPARAGLEGRIAVLDERIMGLETDIAANGKAMAAAQVGDFEGGTTVAPQYGPFSSGQLTGITIVSIVLVWAPLAFAAARIMLRRWAHPKPAPQIMESAARLERMEQAVDAVAIEIERISEGQRFVTQLMAKREQAPALLEVGQAPADPIRMADSAAVARS